MASVIVRGLEDDVKRRLAARAVEHGRSMEAEIRDILTRAARRPNIGVALMRAAQTVGGMDDIPLPDRSDRARHVEFE